LALPVFFRIFVGKINDIIENSMRKARKRHKDELTDEQWEEYFNHQPPVPLPEETMPLKEVLANTSGKTIKQMEKWL
jgi:hypothetical protein